jgi:hypothetical protein
MTVTSEALEPARRTDFMLAHEPAHRVLGHLDGRTYTSTLERRASSSTLSPRRNSGPGSAPIRT